MLGAAVPLATVLCWIGVCCAQQPRDALGPEEVLLNTLTSSGLAWESSPPSAWQETRIALASEAPHLTFQACTLQHRNTTTELWSPPIRREGARQVFLDLTFAQEEEGGCDVGGGQASETTFSVHLTESDPKWRKYWSWASKQTTRIPLGKRFPGEYLCQKLEFDKIRGWLNSVTQLDLGSVTKPNLYLGFKYHGPCFFLASARVYFHQCPAEVVGLALYPKMPGGSGEVAGSCVENSVPEGTLQRLCGVDGRWGPPTEMCRCLEGFEQHEGVCEACRIGFFKPVLGNTQCGKCPPYSHSESEGSLNCPCLDGYYRSDSDPLEAACTKPPSAPENATVHINGTWAVLTWDPPRSWGQRQDGSFQITCSCRPGGNTAGWQPCANVTYMPGRSRLQQGPVVVESLSPSVQYRFSIEAVNGVSHLRNHAETVPVVHLIVQLQEIQYTTLKLVGTPELPRSRMAGVLAPMVAGCLLLLAILGAFIIWQRRRATRYSPELQVEHAVRYRRRTVEETLQLLPIPDSLKQTLKDFVLNRNRLTLGLNLGTGEFGSVYKGVLTQAGSPDVTVAVKTLKDGEYTAEELGSFMSEAALMKSFDHPNVLQLLGVSFLDTCEHSFPMPMVILPFMRHGDLRSFLLATQHREVPMTVPLWTLVGFLVDIASGMEYLGARGFLHRDLAARNCMLREDLRVCVADFGLSRKVYSKDYYRQGVASRMPVKWMAVESIAEYIYTTKTDVWSFGVTMWEVLSMGKTPYPGVQNHEMYVLLQQGHRMEKPPICPEELYDAMMHCWQMCPTRRPTFSELLQTLQALKSSLPLGAVGSCHDEEDRYINGSLLLEACGYTAPDEEGFRTANVYLPAPSGATAAMPAASVTV